MSRNVAGRAGVLTGLALFVWVALSFAASGPSQRFLELQARLVELYSTKTGLEQRLSIIQNERATTQLPSNMTWATSGEQDVESQLQKVILDVMEKHSFELTSFGPATGPDNAATATIAFSVEGSADWPQLLGLLSDINEIQPPLSISELSIRGAPAGNDTASKQEVLTRLVVWGMSSSEAEP